MIYVIILTNLRQNGWKLKFSYRITGASVTPKNVISSRAMVTLGWAVLRSKGEAGGGGGGGVNNLGLLALQ